MSVTFTVMNRGDAEYRGSIRATVGLSYDESWIPEWRTKSCDVTFPRVRLDLVETQTFEMTIPVLPPSLIDVLRQQAVLYSYQAPDPAHDCLGLCITAGAQHVAGRSSVPNRAVISRESACMACKRPGVRVP